METLQQTMRRTYKWSLNRIKDLCADSNSDINDVYDAVSIHEEFSEWLHNENDDHDVFSLTYIGEGSEYDDEGELRSES